MSDTASSRIFIKGLPPTLSDAEFRKHFSQNGGQITDAKIFQNRRIGYIGYKTPEDARKAVKYFNKTFMRMSRIGVEIARPVEIGGGQQGRNAPTGTREPEGKVREASVKRKRESEKEDPKLKEFMDVMGPKSKKKAWEDEAAAPTFEEQQFGEIAPSQPDEDQSDDDYEVVPRVNKRSKTEAAVARGDTPDGVTGNKTTIQPSVAAAIAAVDEDAKQPADTSRAAASDADWARAKTSRLLGLLDDDEVEETAQDGEKRIESDSGDKALQKGLSKAQPPAMELSIPTPSSDNGAVVKDPQETLSPEIEVVRSSMRLFVRNLPYDVKEEDLEAQFASYGNVEEVHVPLDKKAGSAKGYAYIQFSDAVSAENALISTDGETFQGRLLHVLPAQSKRESKLNEFDLSKLPLKKQQQIRKRREAASTTFRWNSLYLNQDAVISSVAKSLGIAKSDVLDPTSSDAAVRQAHAETHIIQETKLFFQQHGVDLDAFKRSARGDVAILVKNIPYDCSRDELERLFGEHGEIKRFLMPPSGVIGIVEFENEAGCKTAFGALAYKKVKSSVLYLEKAPKGIFDAKPTAKPSADDAGSVSKVSASDFKDGNDATVPDVPGSATLFVRNLNFSTTTVQLAAAFQPLTGFLDARVKTKTDPRKPGQVLSMGFGFIEFHNVKDAQQGLKIMDGEMLDGHKLQVRASHKGADAAEERRKQDQKKKASSRTTKIIIKNLPFEASKKDIRALFGAYGQLRSVRVPKKMDRAARGFAFADFTTAKEAESAMQALKDTHLLGRRLVLDFAEAEAEDAEAEIERMSRKVEEQVGRVQVQRMVESGKRRKFRVGEAEGEE